MQVRTDEEKERMKEEIRPRWTVLDVYEDDILYIKKIADKNGYNMGRAIKELVERAKGNGQVKQAKRKSAHLRHRRNSSSHDGGGAS